jgi:hypothetical protein
MIKGMTDEEKNVMIIDRMKDYPIIFCTDFSKYDSSQRQIHLYIEELLCKKICPDQYDDWVQTNAMEEVIINKRVGLELLNRRNRKSGENTTSMGNTFIS